MPDTRLLRSLGGTVEAPQHSKHRAALYPSPPLPGIYLKKSKTSIGEGPAPNVHCSQDWDSPSATGKGGRGRGADVLGPAQPPGKEGMAFAPT